ncbi:hypothetical protein CANCADRAFT_29937 [Tortispora caseinolytica NRRL Y-17796]|uniref:Cyclin-like domain-containing protein n=1 Tax=Tortispora caseinolytica NRRL Y-17796 TaxID=767744 RepID=A0A1E4TIG6_9ASCO|nr:hypothetical protein CANCADRAFT_29937 [Tortispora caseinolytica NRRL Y-17796]
MAANYWESTQRKHWQVSSECLSQWRNATEERLRLSKHPNANIDLGDPTHIRIFLHGLLVKLGHRLSCRQQILATAELYLARFYAKASVKETNPYAIVTACLYLACKIEEYPQHIRSITAEARALWPDCVSSDSTIIGQCEFYLIEEMGMCLIVHQPYRSLKQFSRSMSDIYQGQLIILPDEMSCAWSVLNDSYITDLPLLYPPHIIALAALFVAVLTKAPRGSVSDTAVSGSRMANLADWLAQCGADLSAISNCVQQLLSLYHSWESYRDSTCQQIISKIINTS